MTKKVYFVHTQGQIRITGYLPKISKELDPGAYSVRTDPAGYYLEGVDDLLAEGKLYGDVDNRADRIINTFLARKHSTGVLLEGEKGSGKTLLARRISEKLKEQGMSTLIIGSPYHGDSFNNLVQAIEHPTMLLFDEFEKVYDNESQKHLLTLFDGLFTTKKLFVVTVNESHRVIEQMKNRPGRFFYRLLYTGLDPKFVEEYAADNLKNKAHVNSVLVFASSFSAFNFDILKALIEEMNRYNENAAEASKFLNAVPFDNRSKFKITELKLTQPKFKDFKILYELISRGSKVNPFRESIFVSYTSPNEAGKVRKVVREAKTLGIDIEDEDFDYFADKNSRNKTIHVFFRPEHIVKLDGESFFYESPEGSLRIEKYIEKDQDYSKFLM